MNPDYTADTICRAMQVSSAFVDERWAEGAESVIRVLFMPSFHPEVCVTLTQRSGQTEISAAANLQQFWLEKNPHARLPVVSEKIVVPDNFVLELSPLFDRALTVPSKWIVIDGMPIEACLFLEGTVRQFEANSCPDEDAGVFGLKIIDEALARFTDPAVRNALAACAWYLGRDYTQPVPPPQPFITRLAVLGTDEERADYFDKLKATRGQKSSF